MIRYLSKAPFRLSLGVLMTLLCLGCRDKPSGTTEDTSPRVGKASSDALPGKAQGASRGDAGEKPQEARKKPSAVLPGAKPPGLIAAGSCLDLGVAQCEERCRKGAASDCGMAALATMNGWGTGQDLEQAKGVAERGCAEKDPMSCGVLAAFYAQGIGVPVDAVRAAELLFFACEKGDALSCEMLGETRLAAAQSTEEFGKALEYFLQACDVGHLRACMRAAATVQEKKLKTGRDVNELYRKACAVGFARACSLLGKSLRKGTEGPVDSAGAKIAYDEACQLGDLKSCE